MFKRFCQWFFQEWYYLRFITYKRWRARVVAFFFSRQRWLLKKVPRTRADKVDLIPDVLFACVIHFWEEEKGGEVLEYMSQCSDWCDGKLRAKYAAIYQELRDAYEWAKVREAERESLADIWTTDKFAKWNELEVRHMTSIVRHHQCMWV